MRRIRRAAPTWCAICAALIAAPAATQESVETIHTPDGLTVRTGFGIGSQSVDFDIADADLSSDVLRLGPNVPLYWTVGADWGRLGAAFNINLPETIEDVDRRGESDYFNVQFQSYADHFGIELSLQQHEGMYITNADDFSEQIDDLRVPDLTLTNLGATFIRARNPNYSLAAAYRHNAWTERPSGSFIWLVSANLAGVTTSVGPADGVPAAAGTIWSDPLGVSSLTVTAGAGYGSILTWRGLFVAPLAALGLGGQVAAYEIGDESGAETGLVPALFLKVATGLNATRWIAVIEFSGESRFVDTRALQVSQNSWLLQLSVGYRLGRPWRGEPAAPVD